MKPPQIISHQLLIHISLIIMALKCCQTVIQTPRNIDTKLSLYRLDLAVRSTYLYNDDFASIFQGILITVWHNFRTIIISEIWINIWCDIIVWVSFSFKSVIDAIYFYSFPLFLHSFETHV